jgi:uncharacterized protein YegL
MRNDLTEVVAILDRSGSMEQLTNDTIGGYNSFIEGQKNVSGEVNLTTVLFDDKYEVLHNRVNLRNISKITNKEYFARGSTALFDALGKTINDIGKKLRDTPEKDRPGKVIFFIITDGYENASKEFSGEKIKEMIELQRNKYSWEFIFFGANIDSTAVGDSIGIKNAYNYTATEDCAPLAFEAASMAVRNYRKTYNIYDGEDFESIIK